MGYFNGIIDHLRILCMSEKIKKDLMGCTPSWDMLGYVDFEDRVIALKKNHGITKYTNIAMFRPKRHQFPKG